VKGATTVFNVEHELGDIGAEESKKKKGIATATRR